MHVHVHVHFLYAGQEGGLLKTILHCAYFKLMCSDINLNFLLMTEILIL